MTKEREDWLKGLKKGDSVRVKEPFFTTVASVDYFNIFVHGHKSKYPYTGHPMAFNKEGLWTCHHTLERIVPGAPTYVQGDPKDIQPGKVVLVRYEDTNPQGKQISWVGEGIVTVANLNPRLKNPKRIAEQGIEVLLKHPAGGMSVAYIKLKQIQKVTKSLVAWEALTFEEDLTWDRKNKTP